MNILLFVIQQKFHRPHLIQGITRIVRQHKQLGECFPIAYYYLIFGGIGMAVTVQKLSRAMMRRSMRILDMQYTVSEIAKELGADKEQILQLVFAGAPARKDARGHFWIHGTTFVQWLHEAAPKNDRDRSTFSDNECWCIGCRSVVIYQERRRQGSISFGKCPAGHSVSRFLPYASANKKGENTSSKQKVNYDKPQ